MRAPGGAAGGGRGQNKGREGRGIGQEGGGLIELFLISSRTQCQAKMSDMESLKSALAK